MVLRQIADPAAVIDALDAPDIDTAQFAVQSRTARRVVDRCTADPRSSTVGSRRWRRCDVVERIDENLSRHDIAAAEFYVADVIVLDASPKGGGPSRHSPLGASSMTDETITITTNATARRP